MSPRAPHRFYFAGQLSSSRSGDLTLAEGESHHLLHALRLRPGSLIDLFDASGCAWSARVVGERNGLASVELIERLESDTSTQKPQLNMAVAVLKRRAMDWMIEKLSELDVESLQPVISARCVAMPTREAEPDAPGRWDRLAIAAAKQCGRARPMTILTPAPLDQWLTRQRPPAHTVYAQSDSSSRKLGQWMVERISVDLPLWIAIGPEGGWTPEEQNAFELAGFKPVSLGSLTLRAETAALSAAAACRLM